MGISFLPSLLVLLVGVIYASYLLVSSQEPANFIFSPDHLHGVALISIQDHGNDTKAVVAGIVEQLHGTRDLAPFLASSEEWMFNNAGGAMGAMYILHASLTEYLIIFGTPLGTEGHTGRHTATDYFNILSGTQLAFKAGAFEPEVYPAGSVHVLERGEVKQYKMDSSCFALEYARGWIPGMLLFGYGDGFTSTFDLHTLWRMTWVTGREMVANLLRGKI